MTEPAYHLIDHGPQDPAAQLLAAVLEGASAEIAPLNPGQVPRPEETVWFTSQQGFLEAAARMSGWACKVWVVLRRSRTMDAESAVRAELAIVQSVAERLPDAIDVQFTALSEAAAEAAMDIGIPECSVLGAHEPVDQALPLAEIDPDAEQFRLLHQEEPVALGLHDLNWARLSQRFRLMARIDTPLDMQDLVDLSLRLPQKDVPRRKEYLFITPNGVGLGHLTRQLAVARALVAAHPLGDAPQITFWCFSRAATIVRRAGYKVILRHTAEHLGADGDPWQAWETASFAHYLRHHRPCAVVTDGSRVEPFIVNALRLPGCHHARLIWIRRGMWRSDADDRGLADVRYCDAVLIPGDLATAADPGATVRENPHSAGVSREIVTPPVILQDRDALLDRRSARRALGLGRGPVCLVSLGGDAFARTAILQDSLVQAARAAKVQLVWAQSPLAAQPRFDDGAGQRLALYPITPYLRAFDGIVSAAGYNSFHELLLLSTAPVLFVPTTNARLDDQAARARHAEKQGWAMVLDHEAGDDEQGLLAGFFASLGSATPVSRPRLARDGADEMAQAIMGAIHAPGEMP